MAYHGCAELFQVKIFNLLHLYSLIEQSAYIKYFFFFPVLSYMGSSFKRWSWFLPFLKDLHSELIQYRRAQMIRQKFISEELIVDSHLRRDNGLCPLMPEEVEPGLLSDYATNA